MSSYHQVPRPCVHVSAGSSGTYISNYFLGGHNEKDVNPRSGTLRVGPLAAEYVDGVLTMLFNLTLPAAQYPVSKIIVGKGSKGNPGNSRINEHDTYFQGQIDWAQGTVELDLSRGLTRVSYVYPNWDKLPHFVCWGLFQERKPEGTFVLMEPERL
jgi:hypothetical protein